MYKHGSEEKDQCSYDHSLQSKEREAGARKTEGFVGLPAAVADVEVDGGSVAEEDRERAAQECERVGDSSGGVSQETDPLADEHLVHHVVEGRDQSGDNAGNGILQQKASHRGGAQRVCGAR